MYVCMFVILIVYFCFLFLSCFSTPTPLSILAQLDETKNTRERELYVYSFYFLSFKKANFSSHPFTSPSKEINYWCLINLSYHACVWMHVCECITIGFIIFTLLARALSQTTFMPLNVLVSHILTFFQLFQ